MNNLQHPNEINYRFQESWRRLSEITGNNKVNAQSEVSLRSLQRCLKWCLAYVLLQSYCGKVIQPYCSQGSMIIKKFWIIYWERRFFLDQPPTAQDFFEWYCDSNTIREEATAFNG